MKNTIWVKSKIRISESETPSHDSYRIMSGFGFCKKPNFNHRRTLLRYWNLCAQWSPTVLLPVQQTGRKCSSCTTAARTTTSGWWSTTGPSNQASLCRPKTCCASSNRCPATLCTTISPDISWTERTGPVTTCRFSRSYST